MKQVYNSIKFKCYCTIVPFYILAKATQSSYKQSSTVLAKLDEIMPIGRESKRTA